MSKLISAIEKALAKEYNKGFDKGETAGYAAGVENERKRIINILIEHYAFGHADFWAADNPATPKVILQTSELVKLIERHDETAK